MMNERDSVDLGELGFVEKFPLVVHHVQVPVLEKYVEEYLLDCLVFVFVSAKEKEGENLYS